MTLARRRASRPPGTRGLPPGGNHVPALVLRAAGATVVLASVAAALAPCSPAAVHPANAGKAVVVGNGTTEDNARQVVRTAGRVVYVFAEDDTPQRLGS